VEAFTPVSVQTIERHIRMSYKEAFSCPDAGLRKKQSDFLHMRCNSIIRYLIVLHSFSFFLHFYPFFSQ
jgi:hypothetical protein